MSRLAARGISVSVSPRFGMLCDLEIERQGERVRPLHSAPWIDERTALPEGEAPLLAALQGDFFCAPFGSANAEPGVPQHGWTANGDWIEAEVARSSDGVVHARYSLSQTVMGATVEKQITLQPDHPVVYQRHIMRGGQGGLPVAHHAMIQVSGGARLSFSKKDFGATPSSAPEPDSAHGRSALAYPQRFPSLAELRLSDGGTVDARTYPFAEAHEDLVTLFDPPVASLGWSAAVASRDGFVFFAVKDARLLCQTTLWMSNGGRDYAPWNGRHKAVLGIEESCTHFGDGQSASTAPNELSRAGYRTAITLNSTGAVAIRYALGAIAAPRGWSEVADIEIEDGHLTLTDIAGGREYVPFDSGFFENE
ncbi:hypothetical protein [Mesorhizobium sp. CN2-181]|uniref:hypothetical protein n=1 Tax=Mesorhizobium yinganensis TaxID=3157707 RepID=UPI0032B76F61